MRCTGSKLLLYSIALGLLLAAATPAAAVCLANGRPCGAPITANDRLCCPGSICGPWGNICQPGCRINNTAYRNGQLNPQNSCQVCTPSLSTTQWSTVSNGTSCSDGNRCTQTDSCQGGTCVGSNSVTCYAQDECHTAGTCNPATGYCSNPSKPDNTPCNDYNRCTTGDVCHSGSCYGAAVVCLPQDQCHDAGTCDRATGLCSNPNKTDGTPCDDSQLCTTSDHCQGGVCNGDPVVCTANPCTDPCHVAGNCDPTTGTCSSPNALNGTPCSDGDICTLDACFDGACLPQTQNLLYDHCSNGVRDCDEVDVDCGGTQCQACPFQCSSGGVCGAFGACGAASACTDPVCAATAEGGGICAEGATSCGGLTPCPNGTAADCAAGEVCVVDTCCGQPVCIPPPVLCTPAFRAPAPTQRIQSTGPTVGGR